MKKLSFYLAALLFLAAPFVFVACDDDEGDQTAPSVEVSSPAANARILVGETVQVNAVVEDETGLAEITVALTAAGGNFPLLTLGPNDFTSPTRHVVDQAITVPATVPPGQYAVAITARDLAGNTSSPLQVNVRVNSCSVPGQVSITLNVPPSTPADTKIFVVGTFNGWNPADNAYELNRRQDGTFCISVAFPSGVEYKFTRGGWETVEKDDECGEVGNRIWVTADGNSINATVGNWYNTGTCPD